MSGLDNGPAVLFFFLKFSVKMYFFFFYCLFFFPPTMGNGRHLFSLFPMWLGILYFFLERKRKTDVYENGRQSSRRKNNNSEIPVFLLFCLPVC
jgi:hypothetical protein